jgi:glutamyl-tRNA synthetase
MKETRLDTMRIKELLGASVEAIMELGTFNTESLHDKFYNLANNLGTKPGEFFKLIRIALVGGTVAPGLFESMEALGKDTVASRINAVISII